MIRKGIIELITVLFIILWIYTGLDKLVDSTIFRSQLATSPFIGPFSGFIAIMLPYAELLLAVLLIVRRARTLGLYLSFGLMLLFTGYVFLMLNFAYDLPCSCGGIMARLTWTEHLLLNGIFALISIIALLLNEDILFIPKRKEVIS